jgi:hypothetical protein
MLKTVKQYRLGEKDKEVLWRGVILLKHNVCTGKIPR